MCCVPPAVAQRNVAVIPALKFGAGSTVINCAYSLGPTTHIRRTSALQITQELLRTHGVQGLYKGLGATLMRYHKIVQPTESVYNFT